MIAKGDNTRRGNTVRESLKRRLWKCCGVEGEEPYLGKPHHGRDWGVPNASKCSSRRTKATRTSTVPPSHMDFVSVERVFSLSLTTTTTSIWSAQMSSMPSLPFPPHKECPPSPLSQSQKFLHTHTHTDQGREGGIRKLSPHTTGCPTKTGVDGSSGLGVQKQGLQAKFSSCNIIT